MLVVADRRVDSAGNRSSLVTKPPARAESNQLEPLCHARKSGTSRATRFNLWATALILHPGSCALFGYHLYFRRRVLLREAFGDVLDDPLRCVRAKVLARLSGMQEYIDHLRSR